MTTSPFRAFFDSWLHTVPAEPMPRKPRKRRIIRKEVPMNAIEKAAYQRGYQKAYAKYRALKNAN